ncbi:MAG: CarD family transcriptional regulator [Oscillospiraceae bacterium]
MFSVGDRVVHPMHGAGVIDSIVEEQIGDSSQEYYVFKMPIGGLLLKVPTANSQTIGIRAIVDRAEAERVLASIPELDINLTVNWNRRYRENMLRLKSGDLYEVARVIKGLMRRDGDRGLSTGERKMLHSAKQILISEIVLTEESDYEEVEGRVNAAMALADSKPASTATPAIEASGMDGKGNETTLS